MSRSRHKLKVALFWLDYQWIRGAEEVRRFLIAVQNEDEHVRNFYVFAVATACEWADLPRTRGRRRRVVGKSEWVTANLE